MKGRIEAMIYISFSFLCSFSLINIFFFLWWYYLFRAYFNQLLHIVFVGSALLRNEMLFSLLKTPKIRLLWQCNVLNAPNLPRIWDTRCKNLQLCPFTGLSCLPFFGYPACIPFSSRISSVVQIIRMISHCFISGT